MLLILLQKTHQTHSWEQSSLKKNDVSVLFFKHNFSNLSILDLACEKVKTQATSRATVRLLTHSYARQLEAGLSPC